MVDRDQTRVLGVISYDELLQAYSRKLSEKRRVAPLAQGEDRHSMP